MQDEQIKYIMGSEVGPLLCKGFAYLYRDQPEFPVRKLAEWLLSQGRRHIDHQQISQRDSQKEQLAEQLKHLEQQRLRQRELASKVETWEQRKDHFKADIANASYAQDLLEEWLPEYLEAHYGLAACYVGLLGNQRKTVTDNDEDENAHLDLEAPKTVTYIGASKNSKEGMLGRVLPPEKGISLDVFKEDPVVEGDEGGEVKKDIKQKYIYVPNVLKEERIHYFRLPKLGSYGVFSMVVPNLLAEQHLDKNSEEYKKFTNDKEEAQKTRQNELTTLRTEVQEMERKDDEAVRASEEYINLKRQLEQLENKPVQETRPVFQFVKRQYLVGCDTIGQDKEIPKQTLLEIQQLVAEFIAAWEGTQQKQLIHDIGLLLSNPSGAENVEASDHIIEEAEAEVNSKVAGVKQRTTDEKQIAYELDCIRLGALKRIFLEKGLKSLSVYEEFFVPKFKNALQAVMLFAGYRKQQINLPGTNLLHWRKVNALLSEELATRVLEHTHQGVKPGDIPPYAKISKLQERVDKLDLQGILNYNLGLWMLVKIAKMSLALRVAERDLLLEKYEAKKKDRQSKQEQRTRITEERIKALEAHKATIEPQQLEAFNEAEWLGTYDLEHPLPVIPEEPQLTPYTDI